MKKIGVILTLILGFYINSFSQDFYTVLEDQLTADQKAVITTAKATIAKGDAQIKKAEAEDTKNAKLLSSDKKGKQKKAEKKSVDAKKYRINAAIKYDEGYTAIFNMYMEILNSAEYIFVEDGSASQKYTDDANTSFADGQRVLAKYQDIKAEDALEKKIYTTLKSDLASMVTYEQTGLQMVVDAILLWKGQEAKKEQVDAADETAWTGAKKLDKIPAYKNYLASYPEGKHAEEAAAKIESLEEAFLQDQTKTGTGKKVVYKVQILADKQEWTDARIKSKIYFGSESITKRFTEGYYKYSIGEFKTYAEAKSFKNKTNVKGAFVICFVDGNQVDVLEALKTEGVKP